MIRDTEGAGSQDEVRNFRLNRMPHARFKDVILGPAASAQRADFPIDIDDELAEALSTASAESISQVGDALPILALALQRLVKKHRAPNGRITLAPDKAAQFISDAVADAARDALETANATELDLRRLVVPRLVIWDPRAGEAGSAKRQVASDIGLFEGDRGALRGLAEALVDQRLLTKTSTSGTTLYEVAHEALLRAQPLGDLIVGLREKFLRADVLAIEAREWLDGKKSGDRLARVGDRLKEAKELLDDSDFGDALVRAELSIIEYLEACEIKEQEDNEFREQYDRYQLASSVGGGWNSDAPVLNQQGRYESEELSGLIQELTNNLSSKREAENNGRVYISYSRKDYNTALELQNYLVANGFEAAVDSDDILPGEPWRERMENLMSSADRFVLLMSPDWASSQVVSWEVDYMDSLSKSIVPVVIRDLDASAVPDRLRRFNFVFLRNSQELTQGLPSLVNVLSTDLDWVREHTRLGELARRWENRNRSRSLLLSGSELLAAENWLVQKPGNAPAPTDSQLGLITQSRSATTQRQQSLVFASLAAVAIAVALAGFAYWQRGLALEREQRAIRAQAAAIAAEQKAGRAIASAAKSDAERKQLADAQKAILNNRLVAPIASSGKSEFLGSLVVEMQSDGQTFRLAEDFGFKDSKGVIWRVPKGATVSGASIPRAFWAVVGAPFTGKYRDASILHDYYSQRRDRPWQDVHRMFYEAMIASGVSEEKAKVLYFAVYSFGPRWVN